jgi:hypothetical protein
MRNTRSARRHAVMAILRKESLWIMGIAGFHTAAQHTQRDECKSSSVIGDQLFQVPKRPTLGPGAPHRGLFFELLSVQNAVARGHRRPRGFLPGDAPLAAARGARRLCFLFSASLSSIMCIAARSSLIA